MCVRGGGRIQCDVCKREHRHMSVELRGHQMSFLPFSSEIGSFVVCLCVRQANWPMGFWEVSCLHLLLHCGNTGLAEAYTTASDLSWTSGIRAWTLLLTQHMIYPLSFLCSPSQSHLLMQRFHWQCTSAHRMKSLPLRSKQPL